MFVSSLATARYKCGFKFYMLLSLQFNFGLKFKFLLTFPPRPIKREKITVAFMFMHIYSSCITDSVVQGGVHAQIIPYVLLILLYRLDNIPAI